jgi:hypothetical protein
LGFADEESEEVELGGEEAGVVVVGFVIVGGEVWDEVSTCELGRVVDGAAAGLRWSSRSILSSSSSLSSGLSSVGCVSV